MQKLQQCGIVPFDKEKMIVKNASNPSENCHLNCPGIITRNADDWAVVLVSVLYVGSAFSLLCKNKNKNRNPDNVLINDRL